MFFQRIFGLLLAIVALMGIEASAAQPRVKLATLAPKGSSFHQVLQTMGESWKIAPDGGVNLVCYTDGTMGGEADMVKKMRIGQLQAGMLTVVGLSEIEESVAGLQNMPMMFHSLDEVDYVREKMRPELEKKFRDKGFVVLFWGDAGWVRLFSRNEITTPDQLKKSKTFVWAGDNRTLNLMKNLGYQPVPLEVTDALTGLQTGLIDSIFSTPGYGLAGQFYRPAPHMLDIHWAPLVGGTVITTKAWDALSPATQQAMIKAAETAGQQMKEKARAESEEAVKAMKDRGLIIHAMTPEIEAAWLKAAEDAYPKIRGGIVPADMFDQVQKALAEFRQSKGTK